MNIIKKYTNADKTSFEYYNVYEDGREQLLSANKPELLEYLSANPAIPEVDYVAPDPEARYCDLDPTIRVLRKVRDRLAADGYTEELVAVITLNQVSGRNTQEFSAMEQVRLAHIADAYAEEQERYLNGKQEAVSVLSSQIQVESQQNLATARQQQIDSGLQEAEWAAGVDLSSPVDCRMGRDGVLVLVNGHHRWLAASILGATLLAVVDCRNAKPEDFNKLK